MKDSITQFNQQPAQHTCVIFFNQLFRSKDVSFSVTGTTRVIFQFWHVIFKRLCLRLTLRVYVWCMYVCTPTGTGKYEQINNIHLVHHTWHTILHNTNYNYIKGIFCVPSCLYFFMHTYTLHNVHDIHDMYVPSTSITFGTYARY